jgi:hypothetical protein
MQQALTLTFVRLSGTSENWRRTSRSCITVVRRDNWKSQIPKRAGTTDQSISKHLKKKGNFVKDNTRNIAFKMFLSNGSMVSENIVNTFSPWCPMEMDIYHLSDSQTCRYDGPIYFHWYKILGLLYKRALFDLQFVHNLFWLKLKPMVSYGNGHLPFSIHIKSV